jgi:hypothetical protein
VDWIQLVQVRVPRYVFREHGDKFSCYIKAADKLSGPTKNGKLLDQLSNCQLFKEYHDFRVLWELVRLQ